MQPLYAYAVGSYPPLLFSGIDLKCSSGVIGVQSTPRWAKDLGRLLLIDMLLVLLLLNYSYGSSSFLQC